MLAMNTLALERARQNHAHMERRGEQNHPTPRYGEDVKWLLKIALKLGKTRIPILIISSLKSSYNTVLFFR